MLHDPSHRCTQTHDLRRLLRGTGAVTQVVCVVEEPLDCRAIARFEYIDRYIDGDGVFLSNIAHVDGTLDRNIMRPFASLSNGAATLAFQLGEDRVDLVKICSF